MVTRGFLALLVSAVALATPRTALATEGKPHDWDTSRYVTSSENLREHSLGEGPDGRPEDWGLPLSRANRVYGKPDDWGRALVIEGKPEDLENVLPGLYSLLSRVRSFLAGE